MCFSSQKHTEDEAALLGFACFNSQLICTLREILFSLASKLMLAVLLIHTFKFFNCITL